MSENDNAALRLDRRTSSSANKSNSASTTNTTSTRRSTKRKGTEPEQVSRGGKMPDAWKTKKTKKKKQQLQHPSWSQTSGLSQEFKVPRNQPPSVATFSQMEAYAKFEN